MQDVSLIMIGQLVAANPMVPDKPYGHHCITSLSLDRWTSLRNSYTCLLWVRTGPNAFPNRYAGAMSNITLNVRRHFSPKSRYTRHDHLESCCCFERCSSEMIIPHTLQPDCLVDHRPLSPFTCYSGNSVGSLDVLHSAL